MTTASYTSLLVNPSLTATDPIPEILGSLAPTQELGQVVSDLATSVSIQAPTLQSDFGAAAAALSNLLRDGATPSQISGKQREVAQVLGRLDPAGLQQVIQATGWQPGERKIALPRFVKPDVERVMARAVLQSGPSFQDLSSLVTIPSISKRAELPNQAVVDVIDETARLMGRYGFQNIQILQTEGANPSVYGEIVVDPDLPTVLLYAHADVQPVGEKWKTRPFEPFYRDGRAFGRGFSDDKGGVMAALAAAKAYYQSVNPGKVNVVVLVEGEEEIGSPNLGKLLARIQTSLTVDFALLVDSRNVTLETPTIGVGTRGSALFKVRVQTADHGTHTGLDSHVTDAHMASAALLIDLLDADRRRLHIPGLTEVLPPVPNLIARAIAAFDNNQMIDLLSRSAGMRKGVRLFGDPDKHILESIGWDFKVAVLAQEGTQSIGQLAGQNVYQTDTVLQFRVPPGFDMADTVQRIQTHLEGMRPFGAPVEVTFMQSIAPWLANLEDPNLGVLDLAFTLGYDRKSVPLPIGGSIGFLKVFQERFSGVSLALAPIEDPWSNPHADDESLDVQTFIRTTRSLAAVLYFVGALEETEDGTLSY